MSTSRQYYVRDPITATSIEKIFIQCFPSCNFEANASELLEHIEELLKSSTTHWCMARRERVNIDLCCICILTRLRDAYTIEKVDSFYSISVISRLYVLTLTSLICTMKI